MPGSGAACCGQLTRPADHGGQLRLRDASQVADQRGEDRRTRARVTLLGMKAGARGTAGKALVSRRVRPGLARTQGRSDPRGTEGGGPPRARGSGVRGPG